MKPTIYIATSGGVITAVRVEGIDAADCIVVDYDELETDDVGGLRYGQSEEDFERDLIGETWDEMESRTVGVI